MLTDADGNYRFDGLPMFDESMPVKPGAGESEFEQPEPYYYRVLAQKPLGSGITILHAKTAGASERNDSDLGILTEYDFDNCNMERYGVSRRNLCVSDSFALMEPAADQVNVYDGVFHLRQDGDEPEAVRPKAPPP